MTPIMVLAATLAAHVAVQGATDGVSSRGGHELNHLGTTGAVVADGVALGAADFAGQHIRSKTWRTVTVWGVRALSVGFGVYQMKRNNRVMGR